MIMAKVDTFFGRELFTIEEKALKGRTNYEFENYKASTRFDGFD